MTAEKSFSTCLSVKLVKEIKAKKIIPLKERDEIPEDVPNKAKHQCICIS
jgi:hypothetical protein